MYYEVDMTFHILTLFPGAFFSYLGESILKRAIEDEKIAVKLYNPRDFTLDRMKRIDRSPYGGGPGMVIQAEPVIKTIESVLKSIRHYRNKILVIWLSPGGKQFDTKLAKKIAENTKHIIFICGRYEGIDSRVKKIIRDMGFKILDISVGPYVLTGGELPAMMIIDVVSRQIPGVLGDINSLEEKRVSSPDVYTRPEKFIFRKKIYNVPSVLLSGNHAKIENWRKNRLEKSPSRKSSSKRSFPHSY